MTKPSRKSKSKKPTPAAPVNKGPVFQPQIYGGKVLTVTDEFVFVDFPDLGALKLPRDHRPTKFSKGQEIFFQISIGHNAQPTQPRL